MESQNQTADPDTRTRSTPAEETDSLTHLLCIPCKRVAMSRAKPPRSVCGLEKYGWDYSHGASTEDYDFCVVCRSLIGTNCPVCETPIRFNI